MSYLCIGTLLSASLSSAIYNDIETILVDASSSKILKSLSLDSQVYVTSTYYQIGNGKDVNITYNVSHSVKENKNIDSELLFESNYGIKDGKIFP